MSKHTPGPWSWRVGKFIPGEESQIQIYGEALIHVTLVEKRTNPEDVKLLAAAPELLDMLEKFVRVYGQEWKEECPKSTSCEECPELVLCKMGYEAKKLIESVKGE